MQGELDELEREEFFRLTSLNGTAVSQTLLQPASAALSMQGELDELEREEFFRLKKVQGNKKKHAEAAAAKEAEEVGGCSLTCLLYLSVDAASKRSL